MHRESGQDGSDPTGRTPSLTARRPAWATGSQDPEASGPGRQQHRESRLNGEIRGTVWVVSHPDPAIASHPFGTVVDSTDGAWGLATASFSSDRIHRFRLSRIWDDSLARVNFLMLNPSTADAFQLDPTVRRCVGFAKLWGFGQLEVTNIFALRSTDPGALRSASDPVGVGNDDAIVAAANAATVVVAAWGTHGALFDRASAVTKVLASAGVELHQLRLTKDGHPAHPLYLPGTCTPQPWPLS